MLVRDVAEAHAAELAFATMHEAVPHFHTGVDELLREAELLQDVQRGRRDADGGGVRDGQRALFEHAEAQAAFLEQTGQQQPDRAAADDDDIQFRLHACIVFLDFLGEVMAAPQRSSTAVSTVNPGPKAMAQVVARSVSASSSMPLSTNMTVGLLMLP
jgi:hypothetical protein